MAVNILFLFSLLHEKSPAEGILTGVGVSGRLPYKEHQLVKETKLVQEKLRLNSVGLLAAVFCFLI